MTWPQMKHAIMRNFGGSNEIDTLEEFRNCLKLPEEELVKEDYDKQVNQYPTVMQSVFPFKKQSYIRLLL